MPSSKFDTVILNGIVATAADIGAYVIGIKDGKIAALAASFTDEEIGDAKVIDAEGGLVVPGGVDAHTHIAQDAPTPHGSASPVAKCADDFMTGSRSGICGGTTTFISFAMQTREDRDLIKVVSDYHKRAADDGSFMDYGFHVIITNTEPLKRDLPILVKDWGITSLKLYMTYNALQLGDKELLDAFVEAQKNDVTTLVHAENGDLIDWLIVKLEERGMTEPFYHSQARIPIAEGEATNRAIVLAELLQNPILFVHVSAASAVKVIRRAQSKGFPVMAETCPQYLRLTWQDLQKFHDPICFENCKMICSPPPGPDNSDQDTLWTGLANGTFTIFSSDHCPFLFDSSDGKMLGMLDHEESMKGEEWKGKDLKEVMKGKKGHFKLIPNGCPGIETRLSLLYEFGVLTGRVTPQKFVELTSTNAAKLYGLYPKKGALLPGLSDADLTIFYPNGKMKPFDLTNQHLHSACDYTPFEGTAFTNWPRYTILRGKVMWANGELVGTKEDGKYLRRGPSVLNAGFKARGGTSDPRKVPAWLNGR